MHFPDSVRSSLLCLRLSTPSDSSTPALTLSILVFGVSEDPFPVWSWLTPSLGTPFHYDLTSSQFSGDPDLVARSPLGHPSSQSLLSTVWCFRSLDGLESDWHYNSCPHRPRLNRKSFPRRPVTQSFLPTQPLWSLLTDVDRSTLRDRGTLLFRFVFYFVGLVESLRLWGRTEYIE